MAFDQSSLQDRRPQQPGLTINLASNNPFRRTVSPAPGSGSPPSFSPGRQTPDDKRKSTNPFLDTFKTDAPPNAMSNRRPSSPLKQSNGITFERPQKKAETGVTETLVDLSLQDKPGSARNIQARPPRHAPPTMNHRITQSNGEQQRERKPVDKTKLDIFASPEKSENRRPQRPRRNSDSSMLSVKDEERRRRERERRRRERGEKDGKSRSGKSRKPQGMDIIDQLDVTGLYGPGMIHHDGPFDACNPHRNKKSHRAAPMQAFPVGSLNNVLGGSGPVSKDLNYDNLHGHTVQGFSDYNTTSRQDTEPYGHLKKNSKGEEVQTYNAKQVVEQVHGDESAGLGTSTFFEGTPATRKDIERDMQRRQSEEEPLNPGGGGGGGLSRKRSIAQKIRGIKQRPNFGNGPPVTSPAGRYVQSPGGADIVGTQSAGGRGRLYEKNPFEEIGPVKRGEAVSVAPAGSSSANDTWGRPRTASSPNRNRDRAPSSPRRDLYKVRTQDDEFGMPAKQEPAAPTGFMGRVKSLRSKKRPERFQAGSAAV